ncbi:hypothetical protein L228DRAFT_146922 [Xylona heveae TC161]|uniref:Uncharacterized protein n=1 Tax=Xylona heveae (strain CBS 132557 / TC161) TaxID=1328760 RepID=A0A165GFQ0_XYLHT|nr:hypothetical protein L228DRAFT_146922 [Xylona heveae TC161]KZF22128.1 hypothetical protein L228DRAFT_146922 [Xylona heveae TC161]
MFPLFVTCLYLRLSVIYILFPFHLSNRCYSYSFILSFISSFISYHFFFPYCVCLSPTYIIHITLSIITHALSSTLTVSCSCIIFIMMHDYMQRNVIQFNAVLYIRYIYTHTIV